MADTRNLLTPIRVRVRVWVRVRVMVMVRGVLRSHSWQPAHVLLVLLVAVDRKQQTALLGFLPCLRSKEKADL